MLTVKQVAQQLNLSRSGVYQLIASGQLQALRVGPRRGAIRVRGEDLEAYLTNCCQVEIPLVSSGRPVRLRHIRV